MTIALAIPHTPWVPERVESMARVRMSLGYASVDTCKECCVISQVEHYQEFTERASNKVWPRKMWQWGIDTGADWFLTLQDDVLLPDFFWPALKALLPHVGVNGVLGLSAVNPMGPEIARQGHRWYRTQSGIIGWAYAMRRADLVEFCAWFDAHPELVTKLNEDDLLNKWVIDTKRSAYHPVPTLVDHDTSIDSQYSNDQHAHRRASVTWRDYGEGSLTSTDFWLPSGEPQLLPVPQPRACWFCLARPSMVTSHVTGAAMCRTCLGQIAAKVIESTP